MNPYKEILKIQKLNRSKLPPKGGDEDNFDCMFRSICNQNEGDILKTIGRKS